LLAAAKVFRLAHDQMKFSQIKLGEIVKELKKENIYELDSDGLIGTYAFILKNARLAKNYYSVNQKLISYDRKNRKKIRRHSQ
jgi:hypothetical protein